MENETKNKNEKGLSKMVDIKNISNLSFDDMANMDEKDRKKLIATSGQKEGKRLQLMAKVNDLNGKITKTETAYAESILDSTIDSVDLMIKIKCWREERAIAIQLYNQLFPESPLQN